MTAATTPGTQLHWKDRAISLGAAISDAYEVLIAYAGHSSLFIILFCLIVNVMQMIPSIHLDQGFLSAVFVVQAITMDIGGLSLASMAKHVREQGNVKAANVGNAVAWILILIMITTVIIGYVSTQNNAAKQPDMTLKANLATADFLLLISRLALSVLYAHIVHMLKDALKKHEQKQANLAADVAQLQQKLTQEQKEASDVQAQQQAVIEDLRGQLDGMRQAQQATLTTAKEHSGHAADLQNRLQNAERQLHSQTAKTAETTAQLQSTQARLQSAHADLQTAKTTIADLQTRLQNAEKQSRVQSGGSAAAPAKSTAQGPQNITQFDQAKAAKDQVRAKVSHAEIMAFKAKHPTLKNADVADKLGCSERKIYEAIAWQREQDTANAVEVAQ